MTKYETLSLWPEKKMAKDNITLGTWGRVHTALALFVNEPSHEPNLKRLITALTAFHEKEKERL